MKLLLSWKKNDEAKAVIVGEMFDQEAESTEDLITNPPNAVWGKEKKAKLWLEQTLIVIPRQAGYW